MKYKILNLYACLGGTDINGMKLQKKKALKLKYEKKELAEKLGMSRPTLNTRLEKNNWKKLEIEKLLKL